MQHARVDPVTAGRTLHSRWEQTGDNQLARMVAARFNEDSVMRRERITVSAQNGIIILIGTVSSLDIAAAASAGARRTPGVADVCNALTWRAAPA